MTRTITLTLNVSVASTVFEFKITIHNNISPNKLIYELIRNEFGFLFMFATPQVAASCHKVVLLLDSSRNFHSFILSTLATLLLVAR